MRSEINLYNCDCMEFMQDKPNNHYELAIVDPPFGLGDKLVAGGTWSVKYQKAGSEWDIRPQKEYFNELFRVSKNWIIWGGNYFTEHIPSSRCFIPWVKPNMVGMHTMSDCELALTSFDRNSKSIRLTSQTDSGEERIHVCQKPVALYKRLLQNYAKEGDKILDTHGGSMSIAIACHDMKYDLDLCELDEDYYKAGKERFEKHCNQLQFEF